MLAYGNFPHHFAQFRHSGFHHLPDGAPDEQGAQSDPAARNRSAAEAPAPATPEDIVLLREIRDSLQKNGQNSNDLAK